MEKIGFIPKSIFRTFQRFFKQLPLQHNNQQHNAIFEFRVSRYIAMVSFQCFFFLIFYPWVLNFFLKFFILDIFFELSIIFFNFIQQEQIFIQLQTFSQQFYFEIFCQSSKIISLSLVSTIVEYNFNNITLLVNKQGKLNSIKKNYFLKFAYLYNKQSLLIFRNWLLDVTIFLFFSWFVIVLIPQMSILKIFFIELLLNLNEILKCFFLIFVLDLVVGFHSSKSWEISLYSTLGHFGFQIHQNQNLIAFFISIFPVFLDTISKYWVFRYLNKISPCTVLTYQAMIE